MAVGGWLYQSYRWLPHADTGANNLAAFNAILAMFHTHAAWSLNLAPVEYRTDSQWYAVSEHTGGARLVWCFGDYGSTIILADNYVDNANLSGDNFRLATAYIPASETGPLTGTPLDAGFLPTGALRFIAISINLKGVFTGYSNIIHTMCRDDEVILATSEYVSGSYASGYASIDGIGIMGTILSGLAHDPTDTNKEASICWYQAPGSANTSQRQIQCFTAGGASSTNNRTGLTVTWLSTFLTYAVVDREPWNWANLYLYVPNLDLDTYGIIPGNGEKGSFNPEVIRFSNPAVNEKQRLEGGNFIHIAAGVVVGWDPANGEMD